MRKEKQKKIPTKGKYQKIRLVIMGTIVMCTIGTTGTFAFAKEVKVNVDGTETLVKGSLFQNVGEVLEANGISVGDDYSLSVDPEAKLAEIKKIEVSKKFTGSIFVDGSVIDYKSDALDVGALLEESGIALGELDRVDPSKSTPLTDVSAIKVIRITVSDFPVEREVSFVRTTVDNLELEANKTAVKQAGVLGKNAMIERALYENGVEVKREIVSDEIITAPVNEIIEVGTKDPAEIVQTPVTPPAVEEPPIVEEVPPVIEEPPIVEEEVPPIVEEPDDELVLEPPVVEEPVAPPVVEVPPVEEEEPPVEEEAPPIEEEAPPVEEEEPPIEEEAPPVEEEEPPVEEEEPPVEEEEESPVEEEESPGIPGLDGAVQMILNCTAYTATGNPTAVGVMPQSNHTVAAWGGLPFGTKIYIPALGTTYTVEDRGGAVTTGIIDIYMDTYNECIQFGRQNLEAYIIY